MRDLMTTSKLLTGLRMMHEDMFPTKEKPLQMEVTDLWKRYKPLVGFLPSSSYR
jgi:hypothetical protein